jgi:hypothetical protein
MRRLTVFIGVALALLPVMPASAGGSWLDVQNGERVRIGDYDVAFASVGSSVTMRGTFTPGQQAAVSRGPWYAYLRPDQGEADPVQLGTVDIQGDGFPYVAATTFTVPSVDVGYYWVDVCDLGCKTGVGDLIGGNIAIASTDSEARLFARGLILQWMHDVDVRTIDGLKERQVTLRSSLDDASASINAAERRSDLASQQATEAIAQTATVQESLDSTAQERDLWRLVAIVGLLAVLSIAAWSISLRRRVRALVPDSPRQLTDEPRAISEHAESTGASS